MATKIDKLSAKKTTRGTLRPVPKADRAGRALQVIQKHSATPSEVATALHLEGSWAPQQAVSALEQLVRSGQAPAFATSVTLGSCMFYPGTNGSNAIHLGATSEPGQPANPHGELAYKTLGDTVWPRGFLA
jgi:hypothetical protein